MRERLEKVEEWKKRKGEIEEELGRVWVEGGEELAPPEYVDREEVGGGSDEEEGGDEEAVESEQAVESEHSSDPTQ